jgi:hypothetical protein
VNALLITWPGDTVRRQPFASTDIRRSKDDPMHHPAAHRPGTADPFRMIMGRSSQPHRPCAADEVEVLHECLIREAPQRPKHVPPVICHRSFRRAIHHHRSAPTRNIFINIITTTTTTIAIMIDIIFTTDTRTMPTRGHT